MLSVCVCGKAGEMDALDPLNQTSNNLVEAPKEVKAWDTDQEFPKEVHKGAEWLNENWCMERQVCD